MVCFVFALTAVAFDDMGKSTTVNGWVSDDKCGAKGANDKAEACTKKCLAGGAKMVIVTDGDSKVLAVDNQDALKGHEGHHVTVTGTMKGDTMHVVSTKMMM
jgi:fructose-1-phosphate kinase PfkB-like protein